MSDLMSFFRDNVDSWGAAEWFDRLAKAVREQDIAVVLMHTAECDDKRAQELKFEMCKNIVSSSAMRLVRDYEDQVREALKNAQK